MKYTSNNTVDNYKIIVIPYTNFYEGHYSCKTYKHFFPYVSKEISEELKNKDIFSIMRIKKCELYNKTRRITIMAKSKEELNVLKQEVETINSKLKQLDEEELKYVCGGNNANADYKNIFWLDVEKHNDDDPAWVDWKSPN